MLKKTGSSRTLRLGSWCKLAGVAVLPFAVIYFVYVLPFWGIPFNQARHGRVPLTPPWALECWLWEDDVNNAGRVTELLNGYREHDIPVRTILIDSPWSTRYNDFDIDTNRYPEPEVFFRQLQEDGYRVVLWMTCMVNSYNKDTAIRESGSFFQEASTRGYLMGDNHQIKWWKGRGGFIDYSNPEALKWWRSMQDKVLDWGIDGWKLDGTDTLLSSSILKIPIPFNRGKTGWMTTRQYMDLYSREEYRHGLTKNPDFAVLVRAKDSPWAHPEGFAPLDAATVTWVGDNRHTWSAGQRGLEAAIRDILSSAKLGYCVIGSDVAGYHGRSNPEDISPTTTALLSQWKTPAAVDTSTNTSPEAIDDIAPNIYIRWAQFSTFCGLFLNGGHGERRLWKRTPAEFEIIRKFSWLHTELVPYIYSQVVACHRGGAPLMRPLGTGKFHYLFGDDFLVAPIHRDTSSRVIAVPPGNWHYLFNDTEVVRGPGEVTREFPLDEYPVFIREGAIVPLDIKRPYTGMGDNDSEGFTTWLVYPKGKSAFTLYHPGSHPRSEWTRLEAELNDGLHLRFTGVKAPHLLRIHLGKKPTRVTLDGEALLEGTHWTYSASRQKLVIRTSTFSKGEYAIDLSDIPASRQR